jgi:hypothetical protein
MATRRSRPTAAPDPPPEPQSGRPPDRLAGVERLIVDGTNVIHALGRGRGPVPPASLIGRLRAVVPAPIAIDLVFDEPPAPGLGRRIGPGLRVHHAFDRAADDLIVGLVVEAAGRPPDPEVRSARSARAQMPAVRPAAGGRPRVLVVSDDAELGRRVRRRGAATAPVAWLVGRLARPKLVAPAAGRRRPPVLPAGSPAFPAGPAAPTEPDAAVDDREPWRPGRGATKKRGNPRRAPRLGRGTSPLG